MKKTTKTTGTKVEGEGSYTASRRYRAGLEKSVALGKTGELARKAQKAYDGKEGDELRKAEAKGKAKARMPAAKTTGKKARKK